MAVNRVTGTRSDALALAAHPDAFDEHALSEWAIAQTAAGRPIAIDLFSGAGGLSAGIEAAGWSVAAAVDHDPRALETHRHNFPGLALNLDLSASKVRDAFVERFEGIAIDLVAGGPPCQPFSRAGRSKIRSLVAAGVREEMDLRRELWRSFLDIALRLRPRAVLMENVPDMGLADDFAVIRAIVDELERAGYATQVRLVSAWQYGVPQHRKRLILLARNDGREFDWPATVDKVTLREGIGDLPDLKDGTGGRSLAYQLPEEPSAFLVRMREGAAQTVIHDHMTRAVRKDDLEIFRMMTSKTLYSDIPKQLRRYAAESFTDKYKRLGWEDLSRTITAHIAKDGYWYIHPEEHRTLTVREAARVQTFPDRFRFAGTRSDAFRQIGNAVPPLLGEAAARAVREDTSEAAVGAGFWLGAREALTNWAAAQRPTDRWFMLPGPTMTPPAALAAAALSNGRYSLEEVGGALEHFRGLKYFNTGPIYSALDVLSAKPRHALSRLLPLARKQRIWLEDPDGTATVASLDDGERRVFDMLRSKDVMLRSQSVLRVASRVLGTNSHSTNRLTDGRVDLSRLVGGGSDAASRMAAIRLLAATECGPAPTCGRCPLAAWCVTHQSELAGGADPASVAS